MSHSKNNNEQGGEDRFEDFARGIFNKADLDQDGILSLGEFMAVLRSSSLALPQDENFDDCFEILKKAEAHGMPFDLFVPFLRSLLMRIYANGPYPGIRGLGLPISPSLSLPLIAPTRLN